ncbi:NADPH:quinone reductase-like Zn-dependent oxidoreductase [Arthrobacter ginsengisoli]|uniref:NADPH:quinone reductase-like Zn-dependent oxidoreductase n=1 Tax=Arthrobacter ginsengisoli TaxID=1356565 RepID=A0ABU1U9I6_9MICC|nr:NAD(P)-dependent alcohol dehydrogenase [Arthrobacter ginsengisoli]MDR7081843.1 NADPH:quinone reductase-like Zn-dependent oxidoreductase [Arthrobacter ginsengisoli]
MQAITSRTYGDPSVIRIEELPAPVPESQDLLIRNHATVVSGAESTARSGEDFFARLYFGLMRPRFPILGTSFAGEVQAVGSAVTKYRVGDQVMGSVGPTLGAHAEYVTTSGDGVVSLKPAGLLWTDAVAILDGSLTALPFLRDAADLKAGQSILINGASGAVGTAAVQLARHFGAVVTAVCSTANVELVKSLGADHVIDHTAEDFTQTGLDYDVIFDAVGKSSYTRCRKILRAGGIYMSTVPSLPILTWMLWTAVFGKTRAGIMFTGLRKPASMAADVKFMGNLTTAGHYRPVIDKTYSLTEAPSAHAHVETGHKKGSVVISMPNASSGRQGP